MSTKLIDVSEFQGSINWKQVKESGINYAIIRVGGRFGKSGKIYADDNYQYNIREALNNNINVGVYFFTQAINKAEAIEEANYTLKEIKHYINRITLPVYIDSEYLPEGRHNNISKAMRTNVIKAFCDRIEKAGLMAGVYGSTSYFNTHINMGELKNISVWVAQYNKVCEYKGKYDIWQYTSSGKVTGVKGKVDMNIIYNTFKPLDYPDKIKVKSVNVILGKYGNGSKRVKLLGKDYDITQELVNILKERLIE